MNEEIDEAFKTWVKECSLKFINKQTNEQADIKISFLNGGGKGKVLAYAYYPNSGGDIRFDENELWMNEETTPIDKVVFTNLFTNWVILLV